MNIKKSIVFRYVVLAGGLILISLASVGLLILHRIAPTKELVGAAFDCEINLRAIASAFHSYYQSYARFPAPASKDTNGPVNSWRVAILPFLQDSNAEIVRALYRFDEPWTSESNTVAAHRMPFPYSCPNRYRDRLTSATTDYLALTNGLEYWKSDETVGAIIIIEWPASTTLWTKPEDLAFEPAAMTISESLGSHGFNHPLGEGDGRLVMTGGIYAAAITAKSVRIHYIPGNVELRELPQLVLSENEALHPDFPD